jgi:transposase
MSIGKSSAFLMAKFTAEDKIKAVECYLEGKEGYNRIARKIGVHTSKLQYWVKKFQYHGESAFLKGYTNYTLQYKLDVLKYMNENGTSIFETSAIFNLPSDGTLWNWQHLLETKGLDALEPNKKGRLPMKKNNKQNKSAEGSQEALLEEIQRLRMENAYLKS